MDVSEWWYLISISSSARPQHHQNELIAEMEMQWDSDFDRVFEMKLNGMWVCGRRDQERFSWEIIQWEMGMRPKRVNI